MELGMDKTAVGVQLGAIQRAGVSSRGLSYQIHQDLPTCCILNSLIPKNKVIFSALEAGICLRGLCVFLEQWARIFSVERERAIKPQYKFLLWNGNCWAGLEQGMLELAYLFGRCLMVLHHPQPLELPGPWRALSVLWWVGHGLLCSSHFPGVGEQPFSIRSHQQALPPTNLCPEVMGSTGQGEEP